jgi:formamidopyrimidine-DNA glycosylase
MLQRGVAENRIVTLDRGQYDVPMSPTRRGETTYVYHRDLCLRCGTPIRTVELGGRPCYFCPTCQPR